MLEQAALLIATGVCRLVLCAYGENRRTSWAAVRHGRIKMGNEDFEECYGLTWGMGPHALAAQRHMHVFGTTSRQLGIIASHIVEAVRQLRGIAGPCQVVGGFRCFGERFWRGVCNQCNSDSRDYGLLRWEQTRESAHVEMWKCHATGQQLPIPDEDSQIFWEGCRRQRLLIQQCDSCGAFRFPPSPLCQVCLGSLTTWQEEPGQGEVLTFCIYHSEIAGPAWRPYLPYTVVVVQLWYSGIKILSNLVCDDLQLVRIGLPVRVGFDVVNEWLALPKFFPLCEAHVV